jgi:MFS transporter, MFS domain-containing protein family, molybdate-anion transporter
VYYLYSQYGFDKGDIGRLFIAGFGSSMLFGTIVGSLADKQYASPLSPPFHSVHVLFPSMWCGDFTVNWWEIDQCIRRGRKRACITYCITYILSCMTKHSPQYKVLMLGRVLGGIATSLLFSAFESWLVAEHNKVLVHQICLSHCSSSLNYSTTSALDLACL